MSVNSHLENTSSELVLSYSEKQSIKTSISTLKTRLNYYFGSDIKSQFQFGSSTRGTILPRKADEKSDIDYMIVFDTSGGKYKPQTYLDKLRRFATAKYSRSEIKQSHPTIILQLNHINFELVPAIENYSSYQIPSPSSSWQEWIYTDPKGINSKLIEKNKSNNYKIKPLVRLVKYWNAQNGYPFYSYSLEKNIIEGSFYFCSSLNEYFYKFWSNFNYNYDTPQYIKDKVDRAKRYARNAQQYENDDMPYSAEKEIKKIIPVL